MKTLFIIRHAKSDQNFFGNDFERPLNERGRLDAFLMAKRLQDNIGKIDSLIASPALRAKQTAQLFANTLQIPAEEITFISALYHAPAEVFYDVINGLPNHINSAAIYAHNPGITDFVNSLDTNIRVDNMPTCAIFAVETDISHWEQFLKARKLGLFFEYPKK